MQSVGMAKGSSFNVVCFGSGLKMSDFGQSN